MNRKAQVSHTQANVLFDFHHLMSTKFLGNEPPRIEGEDNDGAKKHNCTLQITGFSDPIYTEAYVTFLYYDIVLDVTVINVTKETLQNLCSLGLATIADLKLVKRPQNYMLALESRKQIRPNIKIFSIEIGVIFGNIVYETSNRNVVVRSDIHIDIVYYFSPASCVGLPFKTMWAESKWENKVYLMVTLL
ncbi:hypothetical protein Cgig2_005398 [Carnegiea gigantea]|uniref:Uncharacterized protein n=1 Tax=Carnegiea gigantea TaxID=171969 RepID=A0A9Q1JU61_9CARY|nr:hypothetical protein Cgig2_005398 [Carnegiea gigantea]